MFLNLRVNKHIGAVQPTSMKAYTAAGKCGLHLNLL